MKSNFTSYDIVCIIAELQSLIGMRVNQIYDIDSKTYLIRLQRGEEKLVLLLESGTRFHLTGFEWPKNVAPSGFTIKMRKHLKNKRLEKLEQVGVDRVVDLQFGSGEAAYHIILELYDRGNIVLTDYQLNIMNILRPHVEGEEFRLAVKENYPFNRLKLEYHIPTNDQLIDLIKVSKAGDRLQTILTFYLNCGPTVVRHVLLKYKISNRQVPGINETDNQLNKKKNKNNDTEPGVDFDIENDLQALRNAVEEAERMMQEVKTSKLKGYIVLKPQTKPKGIDSEEEDIFYSNVEYHPLVFLQNKDRPHKEFDSFNNAVDEFYSLQESQKIDLKAIQQEKDALKKLSNVKKDHTKRIEDLTKNQKLDAKKAELITRNQQLVDNAIYAIRSSLASQMSWPDIDELVAAAQNNQDPVASCIKKLKLEINHISLYLTDPYNTKFEEPNDEKDNDDTLPSMIIDVDLELSAYANARKYHDQRRYAAKKEMKTIESSGKALKSAEKRTQQALKEVKTMTSIQKARKVYWFEKFYWFISSENYLVISGRDQQQNELIVKRYMRTTDIYVHADIQGASSVIIRNPSGNEVPPKTLLEAGAMAISYSIAWDAKVVTSAYWVKSEQVSKTAPTGEYLSTGSFMIRGKKNFLPPCHLILGLSFLFKLEDSSMERHKGERRIRHFNDGTDEKFDKLSKKNESSTLQLVDEGDNHNEIELGNSDSEGEETKEKLDDIKETENSSEETEPNKKICNIKVREEPQVLQDKITEPADSIEFPDTQIKIEHDTGKITVKSDPKLVHFTSEVEENENVIYLGDDKPYIIQAPAIRKKQIQLKGKHQIKTQPNKERIAENIEVKEQQNKRGQKGKLKKIKEKYKDQDEEERKLRMEILKSGGETKTKKGKSNKKGDFEPKKVVGKKVEPKPRPQVDGEDEDVTPATADVDMLDSLTGTPHEEDELLFAIPVIAPYQTLQNYKFKVKLTPGTGRRGKAAKMAVQIFLKDKTCTQREKDLIKNIREDLLARNIPGKVKLSAPQIQKIYK